MTGAGSGINLVATELLLEARTSVVLADLRLRPEAEDLVAKYPHPPSRPNTPSAVFHKTDVADWAQLQRLFNFAVETYGRVDIVVNGAGLFEPPASSFWFSPGISKVAADKADCNPGVYQTFAVNTMAPIRLAQIAVDYWSGKWFLFRLLILTRGSRSRKTAELSWHWLTRVIRAENKIEGNLLWLASAGGYVHLMQCPFYFASKAAIVSFVKSTNRLRSTFGIRNSAICPGMAHVSGPISDG